MPEATIGYEVANALGQMNADRPRLGELCTSCVPIAKLVRYVLNALDLYGQREAKDAFLVARDIDAGRVELRCHGARSVGVTPTSALPLDQRVGGDGVGWMIRRTKRVADLAAQPSIMGFAERAALHALSYCASNGVVPNELEIAYLPTPTMSYVPIVLGAVQCPACEGMTREDGMTCKSCYGSGLKQ